MTQVCASMPSGEESSGPQRAAVARPRPSVSGERPGEGAADGALASPPEEPGELGEPAASEASEEPGPRTRERTTA